jgi:hypothetical protein
MENNYKIYGLRVNGDSEVRYIGYTKRTLEQRLYHHFYDTKKGLTYKKCNWIRKHNYNIEIFLIEDNLTYEKALERESFWITQFDNLLNMSGGGEQNPMNNPEVRAKHALKMKTVDSRVPREKNWMITERGKEWMSQEMKKRWKEGTYKPQPNKNIEYDILFEIYITQNKSLKETSEILNTTYRNITRNLGRLGIRKYKKK